MITLNCICGERYFADESHAGRKIQCLKCGQILLIETFQPNADSGIKSDTDSKSRTSNQYSQVSSSPSSRSPWRGAMVIILAAIIITVFMVSISIWGGGRSSRQ